jgi:ribosome-binding protein aMBF1 (putative translation factor)
MELLADAWAPLSISIAHRVKHALIDRRMMQKELAHLIGCRPQQMSRIFSGKANLTLKTIAKMELVLGIRLLQAAADEVLRNA